MLAFTLAVILLIITPGPAVLSLAGVGASYGGKNATKFLFGLWIGNTLVSVSVILGFAALVLADPMVRAFLALVSAAYLLYLALRIAFAGARVAFIQMDAPGITRYNLTTNQPKSLRCALHIVWWFFDLPRQLYL